MSKWKVITPRDMDKMMRRLPRDVGLLFSMLVEDLENEGPFPKGWQIGHLHGSWKGFLKAKLKRDYRVIYRYESNAITIYVEKISDRKDSY